MFIGNRQRGFVLSRLPVPRPAKAVHSFACPACDHILADGPAYTRCPACEEHVDWVDLALPVWACPGCDGMRNALVSEVPRCEACGRLFVQIHDPESYAPGAGDEGSPTLLQRAGSAIEGPVGFALLLAAGLAPVLSLAADPHWRLFALALIGPILLMPVVLGGIVLGSVAVAFRELVELARDERVRTVHGLEHATAHVLEERGVTVLGGYTGDSYFRLQLAHDELSCDALRAAFDEAVRRVLAGEKKLAYHRRCGTSYLGVALVGSVLALVATAVAFFTQLSPSTLAVAATTYVLVLVLAGGRLGVLLQRAFTVSIKFTGAHAARVLLRFDEDGGGTGYDVHVELEEPRKAS